MSPKTELRPLPTSSIHWLFEAARLEHSFGISLLSRQNPLERGIAHNDVEGEFLGSPCWCVCVRGPIGCRVSKRQVFHPVKHRQTPLDGAPQNAIALLQSVPKGAAVPALVDLKDVFKP